MAMLKQLVDVLGCTVVFATATQPALDHTDLKANAVSDMKEIIPEGLDLFARLKRVSIRMARSGSAQRLAVHRIARCAVGDASLCIVELTSCGAANCLVSCT